MTAGKSCAYFSLFMNTGNWMAKKPITELINLNKYNFYYFSHFSFHLPFSSPLLASTLSTATSATQLVYEGKKDDMLEKVTSPLPFAGCLDCSTYSHNFIAGISLLSDDWQLVSVYNLILILQDKIKMEDKQW